MRGVVPIVDLDGLREGRPGALERIAADVGRAAREIGGFHVAGHGVPGETIDAAFGAAAAFFARPPEKRAAATAASFGESEEAFEVGFDPPGDDPDQFETSRRFDRDVWPDLADFRVAVEAQFVELLTLGRLLHRAIAVDLGADPDHFARALARPRATLRLLHRPPRPAVSGGIGGAVHVDRGNLTLLATDAVGGLELRRADGVWMPASPPPGAFVAVVGDCLARWSNDLYVSAPHRVVAPEGAERNTIAFSLDADPDTLITVLPACVKPGEVPRHLPITVGEHLARRSAPGGVR